MNRNKHAAVFGIFLFLITLPIYGQNDNPQLYGGLPDLDEVFLKQSGLSGIGLTLIDGDPLYRVQLQPDVDLGKIGVGLDVVLLYNPDADDDEDKILAEDGEKWDNLSTFLRVVRYVRYGHVADPFYARFGELDYVTIGHGFIMSGYSNYDRRGLRLNLSNKTKKFGVETMINNLGDPTIFGGRAYIRPLQREGAPPIINRLEFGVTYLTDIEPDRIPDQEDKDKTIDEDPLIALGVDVGLPLIENRLLRLTLYDDLAFLNTKPSADNPDETETATGNAVGLGLSISKALFKVEYRTFGEGFQPTVFDYTYEAVKGGDTVFLGLDTDDGGAKRGYFSMVAWQPVAKVDFLATFEDYNNSEPKLYAGITESGLVDRVSFRAFYTKRDIGLPYNDPTEDNSNRITDPGFFEDLFRLDDKSAFTVRIGYEILPSFEVAIIREYRFHQVETVDGETRFEPIQKTSFEAGFLFNF